MNVNEVNRLTQLAEELLNKGDYLGTLNTAEQLMPLGQNYFLSYYIGTLFIMAGDQLQNEKVIEDGKTLIESDFQAISKDERLAAGASYNIGNAYLLIFQIQMLHGHPPFFLKNDPLDSAAYYFKKALDLKPKESNAAEILVNLGNCLDYKGRVVEALECYDFALKISPNFGMALGNKAKSLVFYTALSGVHQETLIMEAYNLLKMAKLHVTPEAAESFSLEMTELRNKSSTLPLDNPPKYPGLKIKTRRKIEDYQISFCLKNQLFLNLCIFCKKCNAAIGDNIILPSMTVPAGDVSYLILSSYLNQIKQDFITARALMVLASYDKLNLDFFDKNVTITNTFDQTITDIYIQLWKTAFKLLYDILDKIAFFLNDYLNLGFKENRINFSNIWFSDKGKEIINKRIIQTNNPSLNALYSIHKDLDYGSLRALKDTRNALTHRFVKIKIKVDVESDTIMSEAVLIKETIDLAKILRSSIIYLIQFIHTQELKKTKVSPERLLPITIPAVKYRGRRTHKKVKSKTG